MSREGGGRSWREEGGSVRRLLPGQLSSGDISAPPLNGRFWFFDDMKKYFA